MKFWQWLIMDIKRLFRGRGLVLASLLTPLAGLAVFSSVVAPMLTLGNQLKVPYAICNEDESEPVRQFVSLMTNSESMKELGTPFPVKDVDIGYRLLKEGKVGVLVHIPKDFYQTMSAGEDPVVSLIAYPIHSFEQTMVSITLESSLQVVGQSQNILQSTGKALREAGADEKLTSTMLDEELTNGIEHFLERRASLGKSGSLSPVGELFPLEYYMSALFSLFGFLAVLPTLHLTASDLSGPVYKRGLLAEKKKVVYYYFARLLSGAVLILLTFLLLIPTAGTIKSLELFRHGENTRIHLPLASALVLISFSYSAFSMLLSDLIGKPRQALWTGFISILLMAGFSGALVSEGKLPVFLAEAGRLTPLKMSMNLISNVLFNLDGARYAQDMLQLSVLLVLFLIGGFGILYSRGGVK